MPTERQAEDGPRRRPVVPGRGRSPRGHSLVRQGKALPRPVHRTRRLGAEQVLRRPREALCRGLPRLRRVGQAPGQLHRSASRSDHLQGLRRLLRRFPDLRRVHPRGYGVPAAGPRPPDPGRTGIGVVAAQPHPRMGPGASGTQPRPDLPAGAVRQHLRDPLCRRRRRTDRPQPVPREHGSGPALDASPHHALDGRRGTGRPGRDRPSVPGRGDTRRGMRFAAGRDLRPGRGRRRLPPRNCARAAAGQDRSQPVDLRPAEGAQGPDGAAAGISRVGTGRPHRGLPSDRRRAPLGDPERGACNGTAIPVLPRAQSAQPELHSTL
jgi:hypothetical protein